MHLLRRVYQSVENKYFSSQWQNENLLLNSDSESLLMDETIPAGTIHLIFISCRTYDLAKVECHIRFHIKSNALFILWCCAESITEMIQNKNGIYDFGYETPATMVPFAMNDKTQPKSICYHFNSFWLFKSLTAHNDKMLDLYFLFLLLYIGALAQHRICTHKLSWKIINGIRFDKLFCLAKLNVISTLSECHCHRTRPFGFCQVKTLFCRSH